jgi:hypothetical protein
LIFAGLLVAVGAAHSAMHGLVIGAVGIEGP